MCWCLSVRQPAPRPGSDHRGPAGEWLGTDGWPRAWCQGGRGALGRSSSSGAAGRWAVTALPVHGSRPDSSGSRLQEPSHPFQVGWAFPGGSQCCGLSIQLGQHVMAPLRAVLGATPRSCKPAPSGEAVGAGRDLVITAMQSCPGCVRDFFWAAAPRCSGSPGWRGARPYPLACTSTCCPGWQAAARDGGKVPVCPESCLPLL